MTGHSFYLECMRRKLYYVSFYRLCLKQPNLVIISLICLALVISLYLLIDVANDSL
jgi:hypothetical protein